jgi:hypothetical protein
MCQSDSSARLEHRPNSRGAQVQILLTKALALVDPPLTKTSIKGDSMKVTAIIVSVFAAALLIVSCISCANPETPAGFEGYLRQGAWFGSQKFYDIQVGPTSSGLTWLLKSKMLMCDGLRSMKSFKLCLVIT